MAYKHEDDIIIQPQEGFQTTVASCSADIAFIGGGAGGGKTFSLVIEPLPYIVDQNTAKDFSCVYFRRQLTDIKVAGGILDETKKWYPSFQGSVSEQTGDWKFESGSRVLLRGIQHEKDLENFKGAQIPLIIFDELTDFTEYMFFYMMSRNRAANCKMRPYMRASCNPKAGSWVATFLFTGGYLNHLTGYPKPEMDGVIRYFLRFGGKTVWGDTKKEVISKCPKAFESKTFIASGVSKDAAIKSFTFIHGKISENKILLENDPGYIGNLMQGSEEDQLRFLEGNWLVAGDELDLFSEEKLALMAIEDLPEKKKSVLVGYSTGGDPIFKSVESDSENYITCDAAKFGQDLCVIYVWQGWTIIRVSVFYLSSAFDIYTEIEYLRKENFVPKVNVVIDQDGLGGDVVKLGKYAGFIARSEVAKDETTQKKENYKSFKDQCYFHIAEKVNEGIIKLVLNRNCIRIFDKGSKRHRNSLEMKWSGDMINIFELMKNHIRAIKKGESIVDSGGLLKYCTNTKEEQKEILSGASPDFADALMMRMYFTLQRRRKGKFKIH